MELDDILILPQGPTTLRVLKELADDTVRFYTLQVPLKDEEAIQLVQANIILALIDALIGE